jgi:hypothetical protein
MIFHLFFKIAAAAAAAFLTNKSWSPAFKLFQLSTPFLVCVPIFVEIGQ